MTDEQRKELVRRQAEGMRAMSQEELKQRQLDAAQSARNAYHELTNWQNAAASQNWWAQCRGEVDTPPLAAKPDPHDDECADRIFLWAVVAIATVTILACVAASFGG